MNSKADRSRRWMLRTALFGAGAVGLRSLATGLNSHFLRSGSVAHASEEGSARFLLMGLSTKGDPLNVNAPGSYVEGAENNHHATLTERMVSFGSAQATAAGPWGNLDDTLRSKLAFIHHATHGVAHADMKRVLRAHGAIVSPETGFEEELPSLIATSNAASLGSIQSEPIALGDTRLTYQSRPLDLVTPSDLVGLFETPSDLDAQLQRLRDEQLDSLYGDLRQQGTPAQRSYLDRYALSREQARQVGSELGQLLERLPTEEAEEAEDGPRDQVLTAVALIRLNLAPVVTFALDFGGDNHADSDLSIEAAQTVAGVATLQFLYDELDAAGLLDCTTFAWQSVFGRGLTRNAAGGRDHNPDHAVTCVFAPETQGAVIGGVRSSGDDFAATPFDPVSGQSSDGGTIDEDTGLSSVFRTVARLSGVDQTVEEAIADGQFIEAVRG